MAMSFYEYCCSFWPQTETKNTYKLTIAELIRRTFQDFHYEFGQTIRYKRLDELFDNKLYKILTGPASGRIQLLDTIFMDMIFGEEQTEHGMELCLSYESLKQLILLEQHDFPISIHSYQAHGVDNYEYTLEIPKGKIIIDRWYREMFDGETVINFNDRFLTYSQFKLLLSGDIETNPGPFYNFPETSTLPKDDLYAFAALVCYKNFNFTDTLFSATLKNFCDAVDLETYFDLCDCDEDVFQVITALKHLNKLIPSYINGKTVEERIFLYCIRRLDDYNLTKIYFTCCYDYCAIQFIDNNKIISFLTTQSCVDVTSPCVWAFDKITISSTDIYCPTTGCNVEHPGFYRKHALFTDLTICGDVESNPGPNAHSKFCTEDKDKQQRFLIKSLQHQVAQLKKQQAKHNNYVQRQIELEKRDRQRNRKERASDKAYAQGVLNFASNCGTVAEDLANSIGPSMSMIQGALTELTNGMTSIKNLFSLNPDVSMVDIIITIIALGYSLWQKNSILIALYTYRLSQQFSISVEEISNIIPTITTRESTTNITYSGEPVAQSLIDDMVTTATLKTDLLPIAGTLAIFIGIFNLCCSGTVPTPTSMTKHFGNVGRAAQGFRSCKELISWMSNYLHEIYYSTVYGLSHYDYEFMQMYPKIEELYAACKIIVDLDKTTIDSSAAIADQILAVHKQLQEFLVSSSRVSDPKHKNVISNILRTIKAQHDYALSSPARVAAIRKEPMALYLFGEPGVGKSILTDVLRASIFKTYLKDRGVQYDNCSFSRKSENEYWEGYTNQPIVELDDFANMKDSVNKPYTTFSELQYMVNTSVYPLNMATLSQKGNTNFTSEFILASSNQKVPEVKSMIDAGAIYRRFHIYAEISICSDYGVIAGRKADGDPYYAFNRRKAASFKKMDEKDMNPLMTEHYRIKPYYVTFNKQTRQPEVMEFGHEMTFEEFWDYYTTVYESKDKSSTKLANAVREIAGLGPNTQPESEGEIMKRITAALNPNILIDNIAKQTSDASFGDAKENNSIDGVFDDDKPEEGNYLTIRNNLKIKFEKAKEFCKSSLIKSWEKFTSGITIIKDKFIGIAQFFLNIFNAQTLSTYLPRVPTSQIVTGICTTIIAVFGVWYSGLFCGESSNNCHNHCRFINSTDCNSAPCRKCAPCKTLDFPSKGDVYQHFLDRIEVDQIYKSLLKLGIDEKILRKKISNLWRERCRQANELVQLQRLEQNYQIAQHYDQQPKVPQSYNFAQRVYDANVPNKVGQPCAQKIYDTQPTPGKSGLYAQAYVDCLENTEFHKDAIVYAQRDRVQIEQTTQVLLQNSVWVQAMNEDNMAARSNGVFIVGRTLVTTAHTVMNTVCSKPVVAIAIRNPYAKLDHIVVPISECKISQMKQLDGSNADLVLITFPPVVPNRPRILSKFIDAKSLDYIPEGNNMIFSGFTMKENITIVHEYSITDYRHNTKTTEYYLHENCPDGDPCQHPIRIANTLNYDLETHQGMCGALISINNKLIHSKLVGFHVAGGRGVNGIGSITTRQFLESNLADHVDKFGIEKSYIIDGRLPYSQSYIDSEFAARLIHEGDCISIGKAVKPNAPTQTSLSPSLIFGKVQQNITKPAHLKPVIIDGERVDPMIKGIKKVLGPQVFIEPDLLEAAANDVFSVFAAPTKGKVHTYEEAIVGIDGDPYKRSINRTTSPGYPYNLTNKKKGKTHWLGSNEEFDLSNAELRSDVEKLISMAKQGKRGDALSMATLKDEKRPIAKVDAGKTRVFEACPQHLVIAIRQYFLDFAAHVMRHRIDNGIAVGINPYSSEWTKLANHLLSKGNHMIAGDFSNFDGSLSMQVLHKICEKINKWYGDNEEDNLIRTVLWDHISNADVVVFDDVIRQTHSQPSGNPLTVIINSIFNAIVMRIAYLKLKRKQGLPAICDYRKYVSEIVYGDDDIKSVDSRILTWFNQITLTEALSEIGLTYTDETKTGTVVPWKPLSEVAFLKRAFSLQPDGLYLAPMEITNILEITNWIKGKAKKMATLENCECAIMELVLHGKQEYDFWSGCIQRECAQAGIIFHVPTFEEQRELYYYNERKYDIAEYIPLW